MTATETKADDVLRRAALRRQLDLLYEIRDRVDRENGDDYEAWAVALAPVTERVLSELSKLEGVRLDPVHWLAGPQYYVTAPAAERP